MVAETELFSPEDIVGNILGKLLADGILSDRHHS
jgi:hypothetical protein